MVLGLGYKVLVLGYEVLVLGYEVFGPGYEIFELGYEVLVLGYEVLWLASLNSACACATKQKHKLNPAVTTIVPVSQSQNSVDLVK